MLHSSEIAFSDAVTSLHVQRFLQAGSQTEGSQTEGSQTYQGSDQAVWTELADCPAMPLHLKLKSNMKIS